VCDWGVGGGRGTQTALWSPSRGVHSDAMRCRRDAGTRDSEILNPRKYTKVSGVRAPRSLLLAALSPPRGPSRRVWGTRKGLGRGLVLKLSDLARKWWSGGKQHSLQPPLENPSDGREPRKPSQGPWDADWLANLINTPPPLTAPRGAVRYVLVRGSGGAYKSPANLSKNRREFLAQRWGQITSLVFL